MGKKILILIGSRNVNGNTAKFANKILNFLDNNYEKEFIWELYICLHQPQYVVFSTIAKRRFPFGNRLLIMFKFFWMLGHIFCQPFHAISYLKNF